MQHFDIRISPSNPVQACNAAPGAGTFLPWLMPLCCVSVAACLLAFVIQTRHWPLIGDAVYLHYQVFLMQHGMAPYRQIVDAQMPGAYLIDWLALDIFGSSAAGLRLYDSALVVLAIAAMLSIPWQYRGASAYGSRAAAFITGGLLALVHGRDGIPQTAQRDLVMAVLLLAACAFAFHSIRRGVAWLLGVAACCACLAVTIKPTILPAACLILIFALLQPASQKRIFRFAACAGALLPFIAITLFLLCERAFDFGNSSSKSATRLRRNAHALSHHRRDTA